MSYKKHGLIKHPLYKVWCGMRERCYNPSKSNYIFYGGRGIKVCEKWNKDFKAFYDWAIANGWKKELQIDREFNDFDYCPENCRFITQKENSRNRRSNLIINFNGQNICFQELADIHGIKKETLRRRIFELNWSLEKALTTPVKQN